MVQAICLLLITLGTLIYSIYKDRIATKQIKNPYLSGFIGFCLGLTSAFLGIGGGPMNLVVLFYFFSMQTKVAAANSLYIIFFSQLSSLIGVVITNKVPDFNPLILAITVAGGIGGSIVGRKINKKIDHKVVDKLFIGLMILLLAINAYNIWRFA